MHIGLIPSCGRNPKSKKAIIADFMAGKDFIITDFGPWDGKPANIESLDEMGVTSVTVRTNDLRKQTTIKRSEIK